MLESNLPDEDEHSLIVNLTDYEEYHGIPEFPARYDPRPLVRQGPRYHSTVSARRGLHDPEFSDALYDGGDGEEEAEVLAYRIIDLVEESEKRRHWIWERREEERQRENEEYWQRVRDEKQRKEMLEQRARERALIQAGTVAWAQQREQEAVGDDLDWDKL